MTRIHRIIGCRSERQVSSDSYRMRARRGKGFIVPHVRDGRRRRYASVPCRGVPTAGSESYYLTFSKIVIASFAALTSCTLNRFAPFMRAMVLAAIVPVSAFSASVPSVL